MIGLVNLQGVVGIVKVQYQKLREKTSLQGGKLVEIAITLHRHWKPVILMYNISTVHV